ncbi:hypothetical protein [Schleiferia thermophila]|jgi:hypothetical protein|uniref:Uncharacterized protein n=1 Tax=Schleiferia thermophila TaxID=884107 RepID=A0A369A3R1_9FLAO|nr:hypothetical protein [Schleiferia thermophila]KFD38692.1 hypothetical protein AT05_08610 [Schleiferia thermophila str. Yellowstone]RCX02094.1 hypothetical protein DES35_10565 [Schleiferia thermophila]GCD80616.1 hypothetical protein JCM30197_18630 [Schleiferia thermophila]
MIKTYYLPTAQAGLLLVLFLFASCSQKKQEKAPNMVLEREIYLGDQLYEKIQINSITDEGVFILNKGKQQICLHTEDTVLYCVDLKRYTNGRPVFSCSFLDTCNFMLDVLNYNDTTKSFMGILYDDRTYINYIVSKNCVLKEFIIDDFSGHEDAIHLLYGLKNFSDKYVVLERLPQEINYSKVNQASYLELRDFEGNLLNKITEDPSKIKYNFLYAVCEDGLYFVKAEDSWKTNKLLGLDTVYFMNEHEIKPVFCFPMKPYKSTLIAYCPDTRSIALLYIILDETSEHYNRKVVLIYNLDKKTHYYFPVRRDLVFIPFQIHKGKLYFHKYNHENHTISLYSHTIRH